MAAYITCALIALFCSGMLHAKVLRLGAGALQQTTQGQVINLVSNDVQRFVELGVMLHFLWVPICVDVVAILALVSIQVICRCCHRPATIQWLFGLAACIQTRIARLMR
jgi:hypothetical protein